MEEIRGSKLLQQFLEFGVGLGQFLAAERQQDGCTTGVVAQLINATIRTLQFGHDAVEFLHRLGIGKLFVIHSVCLFNNGESQKNWRFCHKDKAKIAKSHISEPKIAKKSRNICPFDTLHLSLHPLFKH